MASSIERSIQVGFELRVFFTRNVFAPANPLLHEILLPKTDSERSRNVLVVLDESLAQARPELGQQIEAWFGNASDQLKLVCPPLVIGEDELAQGLDIIEEALTLVDAALGHTPAQPVASLRS